MMICRGALGLVVLRAARFSCRLPRRVLLSARRELRWMKTCAARACFVVAKHEPGQPRPLVRLRGNPLLRGNRLVRPRCKRRHRERLLVLSRLLLLNGVRRTGRVE